MKSSRFLAALLATLFIAGTATAEGYTLPVDGTPGPKANPACFLSDSSYQDESLKVDIESQKIGDSVYHVARNKIASPTQLRTALAGPYGSKKTDKTTAVAAGNNAVIAVNGDYFQYRSSGFEVRQGEVLRKSRNTDLDLLVIDENGDFHILKKSNGKELAALLTEHTAVNAFTFGPALVKDGQVQNIYKSYGFAPQDRAPRVGIGQMGPLDYVIVVVDGRQEGYSRGISIKMLAEFMGELGCQQAFNLDGGGTAQMAFMGKRVNDLAPEYRRTADMIYITDTLE
jgi:exopolysaccharide biosynthesis protein